MCSTNSLRTIVLARSVPAKTAIAKLLIRSAWNTHAICAEPLAMGRADPTPIEDTSEGPQRLDLECGRYARGDVELAIRDSVWHVRTVNLRRDLSWRLGDIGHLAVRCRNHVRDIEQLGVHDRCRDLATTINVSRRSQARSEIDPAQAGPALLLAESPPKPPPSRASATIRTVGHELAHG